MAAHLHGFLVSFPVVLFTLAVILFVLSIFLDKVRRQELFSLDLSGFVAIVAAVSVWPAFFSGYFANEEANGLFIISDNLISLHQTPAKFLLFISLPLIFFVVLAKYAKFNKLVFRSIAQLLLILSFILVLTIGWRGSNMVFLHGAGIKGGESTISSQPFAEPKESTKVP